jgi:8-oxo-dGTP pyrophosphatase MutT (NUDIX family)
MRKEMQKFWVSQAVILIRDNKCLLVRSAKSGLYGLPGGRIDLGEHKDLALARELQEELGITHFEKIGLVDYLVFYDLPSGIKLDQPVCAIINLINSNQEIINKDKDEHSAMIWVAESEIDNYKYCWYGLDESIKKAFVIYNSLNK